MNLPRDQHAAFFASLDQPVLVALLTYAFGGSQRVRMGCMRGDSKCYGGSKVECFQAPHEIFKVCDACTSYFDLQWRKAAARIEAALLAMGWGCDL